MQRPVVTGRGNTRRLRRSPGRLLAAGLREGRREPRQQCRIRGGIAACADRVVAQPLQRIDRLQQQLGDIRRQRSAAVTHQSQQVFGVMRDALHAEHVERPGQPLDRMERAEQLGDIRRADAFRLEEHVEAVAKGKNFEPRGHGGHGEIKTLIWFSPVFPVSPWFNPASSPAHSDTARTAWCSPRRRGPATRCPPCRGGASPCRPTP